MPEDSVQRLLQGWYRDSDVISAINCLNSYLNHSELNAFQRPISTRLPAHFGINAVRAAARISRVKPSSNEDAARVGQQRGVVQHEISCS